jgi:hypothetical protein
MEQDLLIQQMKYPEDDYCHPIPREVEDLWAALSDGGTQCMYSGFEYFYFERTHSRWTWERETLTRGEVWKEWVTEMVGK